MAVKLRDAVGNPRGRNTDKNHRVAKLMRDWDAVKAKLEGMVRRGAGRTEPARYAYGVLLIMHTGIRVGNEESAEGFVSEGQRFAKADNPEKGIKAGDLVWQSETHGKLVNTYGLTTLRHDHVVAGPKRGGPFRLEFVGKKIVDQNLEVDCPVLCKYRPAPGKSGEVWLNITDARLRKFVRRTVGRAFVPKDIRRAFVNRQFLEFFPEVADAFHAATKQSDRNKIIRATIEATAAVVGHTPGVCRSAYLSHPMLDTLKRWTPDRGPIV